MKHHHCIKVKIFIIEVIIFKLSHKLVLKSDVLEKCPSLG